MARPGRPERNRAARSSASLGDSITASTQIRFSVHTGVPSRQTSAARFDLKVEPIAWHRNNAGEDAKPRGSRHHSYKRERLDFVCPKSCWKFNPNAINVISIDAIKLERCAVVRACAQGIDARDARIQTSARKIFWNVCEQKEGDSLPLSTVRQSWVSSLDQMRK
jgi:hypothetical protein